MLIQHPEGLHIKGSYVINVLPRFTTVQHLGYRHSHSVYNV